MGKDLIIVESPAKVKTIKKFLGNAYAVEASVGHVRDLPQKKLGVDEKEDFAPQYQIIPGKQKVVTKLKDAAASASTIYLAPDPDREGEAIAWHVAEILKDADKPIHRIQFNEITAKAVREALAHPRDINEKLFLSQQARRILDRLVGYKVSPILWQKVKSGISAGRVQSVALRLVVDREKERRAFVPVEYWNFKARLAGDTPPEFEAELVKFKGKKLEIGSAEAAAAAEAAILGNPFVVAEVAEKERKKSPPPPFITSTLQQAANQRLGYSAKRTMGAAQKLYEGLELGDKGTVALITYMRTDSTRIADEARDAAREFIVGALGPDYYPEKARHFRTKAGAQDAHEAIRPVDVTLTPADVKALLPKDLFTLYKLIWERFVASQMSEARFWDTAADIAAGPGLFKAKGQRLIFPGYLKVYGQEAGDEAKSLPPLAKDQVLRLLELKKEQKFTQPPPRYTEASLVRELEEKGIGRPSTYAAIISTLIDRDYARLEDKHFVPSELGETVSDLLAEHFVKIMDVGFTAGMEEALDAVAEGRGDWVGLLKDFTDDFYPTLAKAAKDMAKVKAGKETDVTCELCGKPMVIRFGKAGEFLGCSGYPDCKNTKEFDRAPDGAVVPRERKPEETISVGKCPQCGKDLAVKKSRTGSRFIACTGWPDCKYTKPFSTGVPCPREGCTGTLVEKSSKRGKVFYACDAYPQCDFALWDWPVPEHCPECDSKVLVRKKTRAGEIIACPNRSCRYTRPVGGGKDEKDGKDEG
ncbi:type I DNA topoisomerase [Solidesulfovibrio sp.]|uniref:type I DNA topoisomerase n=1 Tax=Solidesulfovibrio sp. TaxID=2910990 RepID=UPI002B1FDDEF|nr:type I DNA topoisomerase [Solidesulfovibrio sp.]MEA5087863.1 type I DNA topoisomerase [Solidesulfovibrio sp.]